MGDEPEFFTTAYKAGELIKLYNNLEKDHILICSLASNPMTARDMGISAEIRPGVIDTVKVQWLAGMAQSNAELYKVNPVSGALAFLYKNCLAKYGAIIAQAYLNLTSDLTSIKGSITKSKSGEIEVKGMGYDDFVVLADRALKKAMDGIENSTIKRTLDRITADENYCRFDREITNIKCGHSLLVLGTKPQLYVSGVPWYGERFAGYHGSYKVSKSWSYQDAIEKLKTTAKYSKWAYEVQKYAEDLRSQGRTKEAVMVRKKAWDIAKSGKQTVSPAKLMPGIN